MLESGEVTEIFMKCLFKEEEDSTTAIIVEGVRSKFGFHPQRLEENKPKILEMVSELDVGFKGGWSFLNLCLDKNGRQWTDFHKVCEQLLVLGLGVGCMRYVLPREMWDVFPSSMPYVQVIEDTIDG